MTGLMSASAAADNGEATRSPVLCLVTEMGFKRWSDVLIALASFRRMRKASRGVDALLETSVLIRPGRRLLFVSLWCEEDGVSKFATAVPEHPARVAWCRRRDVSTWSGLFDFVGVSPTSSAWQGSPPRERRASLTRRERT